MKSSTSTAVRKVQKARNEYGPPSESPSGIMKRTRTNGSITVQQRLAITPNGTSTVWHDSTPEIESREDRCARKQRNKSSTQAARRLLIATHDPIAHEEILAGRRYARQLIATHDPSAHEEILDGRRAAYVDVAPEEKVAALETRRVAYADVAPGEKETALDARRKRERVAYAGISPEEKEAALETRRKRERSAYAALPLERRDAKLEIRRIRRRTRQVRQQLSFPCW